MKSIVFIAALVCSITVHAQSDSAKYTKNNGHGTQFKRTVTDSVAMMPVSTSPHVPYRQGGYRYNPADSTLQLWTGSQWISVKPVQINDSSVVWNGDTLVIGGTAQNLQAVTDNGRKTDKSIQVNGLYTPFISADTAQDNAYNIVVFPDLQNMTQFEPGVLKTMFDWVIENKVSKNIQAVFTVGDLTNNGNTTEMTTIDAQFDRLDSLGVPYIPVIGNHDYNNNAPISRNSSVFNTYFGPSRFSGYSWYGGNFEGKSDNAFYDLNIGSHRYRVMALEYFPRDEAMVWARAVLDTTDRDVIILTHGYMNIYGQRSADTTTSGPNAHPLPNSNAADSMWYNSFRKYANVKFIINGHFIYYPLSPPPNRGWANRFTDKGENGNVVHQLMANFQQDHNRGDGYMMLMDFKPSTSKIDVTFYSKFTGAFDTLVKPYSLSYPNLAIRNSVGIAGEVIADDVRADSNIFVNIPYFRVPYISDNNKIISDDSLNFKNKTLSVPRLTIMSAPTGKIPFFGTGGAIRTNTNFSFDSTSGNVGIGTSAPALALDVRHVDLAGGVTSIGTHPLTALADNLFSTFNVTHGGSNYGLSVTRADASSGAANLSFYKTRSTDANVKTPLLVNDRIGGINFLGISGNGSSFNTASLTCDVVVVTPEELMTRFTWRFRDTIANGTVVRHVLDATKMGINTSTPAVSMHVAGTDGIAIPGGNTGLRPTGAAGYLRYNSDTANHFEIFDGSAWMTLATRDWVRGLGYMTNPMTTAGDIITGGGSGTPTRLGIGSAFQLIGANSGATALEYKSVSAGEGMTVSHSAGSLTISQNSGDRGSWTPSTTLVTNADGATVNAGSFTRKGNIVTASLDISVDPTGAGIVEIGLSPVTASTFSTTYAVRGTASTETGLSGRVTADTSNNRLKLRFTSVGTTSIDLSVTVQYTETLP